MFCSVGLAWGYGFLAVTIISCASLCGAFVVPFMNKDIYKILLLFMVSLSVGVLCGSGIFHLIPHVSSVSLNAVSPWCQCTVCSLKCRFQRASRERLQLCTDVLIVMNTSKACIQYSERLTMSSFLWTFSQSVTYRQLEELYNSKNY